MRDTIIKIEDVKKQYRLGLIGGGSLQADLQSWWARIRGKEDPNSKIGAKTYGKNEKFMALDGINLEVKRGERVGIIGHNGAGKSTLLKLLSRVTAPTDGRIYLNGRISSMLEVGTGFHGELTGRENIYLNGAILGMTRDEVTAKMDKIIEFSECGQFIDTPVKRYSSGMYVKLAFSVAAHLDSEILIMDEVLAVGDMAFQQKCINKMNEVSQSEGRTILYVSHNMATIRQLCDRCVVLDHGKVIFDGDVEEAVQIYMGARLNTSAPLAERKRTAILTNDAKMIDISVENNTVKKTEKLRFRLKTILNSDCEDLRFRMTVKYHNDSSVGLVISDPIITGKKGQENETEFAFDCSMLAPGKYYANITLFFRLGNGNTVNVDHVEKAFEFIVIEDEENLDYISWTHHYWGSIDFGKIQVSESKAVSEQ